MKSRTLLLPLALLIAVQPAIAKEERRPSRPPVKGCAWEKASDAALGLEAWVQRCDFGFRKIDRKADPNEVPEPPCGDWGTAPDGIQYFEAHPSSNARKVLFVRVGQDEPLFDEKTLRLVPPR